MLAYPNKNSIYNVVLLYMYIELIFVLYVTLPLRWPLIEKIKKMYYYYTLYIKITQFFATIHKSQNMIKKHYIYYWQVHVQVYNLNDKWTIYMEQLSRKHLDIQMSFEETISLMYTNSSIFLRYQTIPPKGSTTDCEMTQILNLEDER